MEKLPEPFNKDQQAEICNLYHLARTALSGDKERGRWARMNWAAKEYAKEHGISVTWAYKQLDRVLS